MLEEVHILFQDDDAEMVVFADLDEALKVCDDLNNQFEDYWRVRSSIKFKSKDYRKVYVCPRCKEYRTWCDGGTDSEMCDKCWAETHRPWWWRWSSRFFPAGCHHCGECV